MTQVDVYTRQMDNSSFFRDSRFSEDTTDSGFGEAFTFCTGDIILWVLLILLTIGSYRNKGLMRIFGGYREKSIDLNLKKSEEISEEGKNDEEMNTIEELKKAIEIEKEEKNRAITDLENERMSSTCATNVLMDMILRLQFEKSSIQIEAKQSKRLAELRQRYDQEIIQSLRWERSVLENQLKLCSLKLRESFVLDELEQFGEKLLNCANVEDHGASTGN